MQTTSLAPRSPTCPANPCLPAVVLTEAGRSGKGGVGSFPESLHRFLLHAIPARGFQRMRSMWALVTGAIFLAQWQDVSLYYGAGTVPFYVLLLISLLCVFLNIQTRSALVAAFLLFTFFLRRNPLPFGGGELLLHNVGFLLMVAPGMGGRLTLRLVPRLRCSGLAQGPQRAQLRALRMPIWPYRLLLFQVIVLYSSSAWQKLLGTTWLDGSALMIALAHPHFARFPGFFAAVPEAIFSLLGKAIIVWELAWIVLLLPRQRVLTHALLLSGVIFHLVILVFLKVGSFSIAMLAVYLGLVCAREKVRGEESQTSSV